MRVCLSSVTAIKKLDLFTKTFQFQKEKVEVGEFVSNYYFLFTIYETLFGIPVDWHAQT